MSRKPANLEMTGGKSPRQRIWEAIRARRKSFTHAELMLSLDDSLDRAARDYLKGLQKSHVIDVIAEESEGGAIVRKTYRLVRDSGLEAPRIRKTGEPVVQGAGNEAMWGTMHRMFERKDFDYRELAIFASTPTVRISETTARSYIKALSYAGYLRQTKAAHAGKNPHPARYSLIPKMYTGPRAPMVQRTKVVFDPNENRVMWVDTKEIEDAL